jgi:acyl-CoA synthetase (NDP forming)
MELWTDTQLASIHKMLNPRSIAVIGATPRMQYGGKFFKRVLSYADRVNVYAVNPRYDEVLGQRCYRDVAALPEAPDVAAVVVPHHAVLQSLRECHARGVGSAIVISAGFAERGGSERQDLQAELGEFARSSGMRISGPNCLGLANIRDDLWLTSSTRITKGVAGPVGLVCQSGASLFGPFLARAMDSRIGLSYAVSTGNEADLEFADFARYLLDDPGTRVIAGYIEGFKNAAKFIEVAKLAAARGKPIVLIKIGRSALGAKAANSHTAALTGSDALYDAVCRQYGVVRVQSYDDLLEVSQLLARCPAPQQQGVAVVSHSGGVSSLTADMLGQAGIDLPTLTAAARDAIDAVLKGFGSAANPADVTGYANGPEFPALMQRLIDEPTVGTLVVASAGGDDHAEQVIALRERASKNVIYLWTGSRLAEVGLARLKAAQVPVFYTPDALARALRFWLDHHAWRARFAAHGFAAAGAMTDVQEQAVAQARRMDRPALSESESKRLVAAWGVPVAVEERVHSADAAVDAATRIGYPVVMKVDSPDIPHKTEAGIVRLGLRDAAQVRDAHASLLAAAERHDPAARVLGVLVQEMVQGGVEVIVGLSHDEQLGPTLLFGSGGVLVEVYNDVALRRCPITRDEARGMLAEVKGSRLLQGFRGKPEADVDALLQVLVDVSQLGAQLGGHGRGDLAELDINPLLVLPRGQGVKAVDALVVLGR